MTDKPHAQIDVYNVFVNERDSGPEARCCISLNGAFMWESYGPLECINTLEFDLGKALFALTSCLETLGIEYVVNKIQSGKLGNEV